MHFRVFNSLEPGHSILRELLNCRLQLHVLNTEVIDSSNSGYQVVRVPAAIPMQKIISELIC